MPTTKTKTKQNTNVNQQFKPKANTHKQSGNDNTQTHPSHSDLDMDEMTPLSWLKVKKFSLPPRKDRLQVLLPKHLRYKITKKQNCSNQQIVFISFLLDVETGPDTTLPPNLNNDNH